MNLAAGLRNLLLSAVTGKAKGPDISEYDNPVILSDPFFPISYSLAGCRNHTNPMHRDVDNLRFLCLNNFNAALSAMYTGRQFSKIRQKWLTAFDGDENHGESGKNGGRSVVGRDTEASLYNPRRNRPTLTIMLVSIVLPLHCMVVIQGEQTW